MDSGWLLMAAGKGESIFSQGMTLGRSTALPMDGATQEYVGSTRCTRRVIKKKNEAMK